MKPQTITPKNAALAAAQEKGFNKLKADLDAVAPNVAVTKEQKAELQHDLLALVRLALAVDTSGVGVGDVASDDVHPQSLRGERRARDSHAAEETHLFAVLAPKKFLRSVRHVGPIPLGRRVPVRLAASTFLPGPRFRL